MPKKATSEYWKETISNIFGNIIDLKYIDYSKNNKFSQKMLICNEFLDYFAWVRRNFLFY